MMLSFSAAAAAWRAGTADPVLLDHAKSLLTSLHYYLGPQPGEAEEATLSRALTNWLFHHNLPASVPVTPAVIDKMQADLAAGDLFPLVNSPIGSSGTDEPTTTDDLAPAQPPPERNVEGYCKKIFPQSNQLYTVCTRQQRHAFNRLKEQWPNVPEHTREYCGQAFAEEYQLLLVCINLEPETTASTPSPNK